MLYDLIILSGEFMDGQQQYQVQGQTQFQARGGMNTAMNRAAMFTAANKGMGYMGGPNNMTGYMGQQRPMGYPMGQQPMPGMMIFCFVLRKESSFWLLNIVVLFYPHPSYPHPTQTPFPSFKLR